MHAQPQSGHRLPALRSRNFRLFFAGQMVSLLGTWMQHIAMIWLAYRLTDSVAMLGLVGFASQVPILLFSTLAGVWIDRLDRRRLLFATQLLALLQALLLFALTVTHAITPEILLLLAFLLGCINAMDMPVRQAFVAEIVTDRDALPNAIGLNSLLMNASRFLGPTLAGVLVATRGEAICFLVNALSYVAVLGALAAMRLDARPRAAPQAALAALRAGLAHAFGQPAIRLPLLMVAGFSFLATPYAVLMPAFARDIYAGGADTYGFLIGSAGSGALCAAVYLAMRRGGRAAQGLDRLVARAALAGGVALTAFSLVPAALFAYPLLFVLGASVVLVAAGSNTLIQTRVDEHYRGRVMALFSTAFLGVAPLGSLAAGSLASLGGVRLTLCLCGLLATALGFAYVRTLQKNGAPTRAPQSADP